QAKGRYVVFLNQDTEIDKDCVRRLYRKSLSDPSIGAVAPLMKFMELPGFINGLGNQINNHGWGTDNFIHCVDVGQFGDLTEIPSVCFGAVLLRRDALDRVGPVDEGYGSFYEDVDWSLRCWLGGWKIVPEAQAVVYHKFGASYPSRRKLVFIVRNRLRLVLKTFQGRVMLGFLKNYMREDLRSTLSHVKKRDFGTVFCFVKAYVSLMFGFPGILLKRAAFMRSKDKTMRERDVLQKNPSFYCCLHAGLDMPEIDVAVIRRYYRRQLL
ncbi:glycosyltransferase family 2 protein, partial [Acidobacteriota bacterium]